MDLKPMVTTMGDKNNNGKDKAKYFKPFISKGLDNIRLDLDII